MPSEALEEDVHGVSPSFWSWWGGNPWTGNEDLAVEDFVAWNDDHIRKHRMKAIEKVNGSYDKNSLSAASTVYRSTTSRSTACSSTPWSSAACSPSSAGGSLLLDSSFTPGEFQHDLSPKADPSWINQASSVAGPELPCIHWEQSPPKPIAKAASKMGPPFVVSLQTPVSFGGCLTPVSEKTESAASSLGDSTLPVRSRALGASRSSRPLGNGCELPTAAATASMNPSLGAGHVNIGCPSLGGLASWDDCDNAWELQFMSLVQAEACARKADDEPPLPRTPQRQRRRSMPEGPPPRTARHLWRSPSSPLGLGLAHTPDRAQ